MLKHRSLFVGTFFCPTTIPKMSTTTTTTTTKEKKQTADIIFSSIHVLKILFLAM